MNAELCFREFDFFEIYFLFKIDDQFNSVECENLYEMSLVDSNTFEIFDLFSLVPISFRFLFLYFLLSIRVVFLNILVLALWLTRGMISDQRY